MDLNGPALAPPDGVTPNFDNPPNNNALAIGVLSACAAVSTICLFIRAYGRIWLLRKVQIEEGYFVHQWNIRLKDMILIQYDAAGYSLQEATDPRAIFGGAGIGIVVSLNMQCIPHSAIWDITILATSKCFDLYKLQVASASIQLISDVAILLLPQQPIWSLKMTWRKRMGVSIIFSFGLLACISAVFRLETTITHGKAADAIWTLPPLAFWATAEMTCGFFIVALPCIPKILKETGLGVKMKRVFGMSTSGNTSKRAWESEGTGKSSDQSRLRGTTASNAYYKLDPLKPSESTEYLQNGANDDGIVRTTRITVTQDEDRKYMYP
ncbi:uncharacterized protein N7479_007197 [Penicillium vulpinum]|uniref:uncharacterized protein n=1 Tax=Penicillium vulpinum TaxID=29845 RepID=UPI002547B23E|nr:uncharacterized protein N7479_007197 [Penicillium vulpinum]KAJ5960047.1 hypothetical protein N7479_007197 [Penicillium vulpinum]